MKVLKTCMLMQLKDTPNLLIRPQPPQDALIPSVEICTAHTKDRNRDQELLTGDTSIL